MAWSVTLDNVVPPNIDATFIERYARPKLANTSDCGVLAPVNSSNIVCARLRDLPVVSASMPFSQSFFSAASIKIRIAFFGLLPRFSTMAISLDRPLMCASTKSTKGIPPKSA